MLGLNSLTRGRCPLGLSLLPKRPKSTFRNGRGTFCSIVLSFAIQLRPSRITGQIVIRSLSIPGSPGVSYRATNMYCSSLYEVKLYLESPIGNVRIKFLFQRHLEVKLLGESLRRPKVTSPTFQSKKLERSSRKNVIDKKYDFRFGGSYFSVNLAQKLPILVVLGTA